MMKILASFLLSLSFLGNITADETVSKPEKVIILTIPKSGTHLIHAAVSLISSKPVRQIGRPYINFEAIDFCNETIDIYHLFPEFEPLRQKLLDNAKIVIMIRDPRDVIVSRMFYIEKLQLQPIWSLEGFQNFDYPEKIKMLLQDKRDPIFIQQASQWMQNPEVFICCFEDLVGPKGGGDRIRQMQTIQDLAVFMGFSLTHNQVEQIADSIFGENNVVGKGTFRSGQIGSWKDYFTESSKAMFKEHMGQALIDMGYEQDNNW